MGRCNRNHELTMSINNKIPGKQDFIRAGISWDRVELARKAVAESEAKLAEVRADDKLSKEEKTAKIKAIKDAHTEYILSIRNK